MKKSTKIVLAAGAVAVLVGGFQDVMSLETSGLRQAHQAAGWQTKQAGNTVKCETLKEDGNTWALCRHWRATPSAWLKQGDDWASANGPAISIVDVVAAIDSTDASRPYQDLPRLFRGKGAPPMPDSVRARMDEIRSETIADSR